MVTTQVYRVYIKATPEAIWDAITKARVDAALRLRRSVEYDLRPGGEYRWLTTDEMRAMGAPELGIDGEVIEVDPPRKLVQTWRMVMDPDLEAQGFTRVTYEIAEGKGGVTKLTVPHDVEGAPKLALVVSGGMEDAGAGGGWSWVLSDLKTLLETGTSLES